MNSDDMYINFLAHYGIKGQKHGVRRFQNEDRTWTEEGKKRYGHKGDGKRSKYMDPNAPPKRRDSESKIPLNSENKKAVIAIVECDRVLKNSGKTYDDFKKLNEVSKKMDEACLGLDRQSVKNYLKNGDPFKDFNLAEWISPKSMLEYTDDPDVKDKESLKRKIKNMRDSEFRQYMDSIKNDIGFLWGELSEMTYGSGDDPIGFSKNDLARSLRKYDIEIENKIRNVFPNYLDSRYNYRDEYGRSYESDVFKPMHDYIISEIEKMRRGD